MATQFDATRTVPSSGEAVSRPRRPPRDEDGSQPPRPEPGVPQHRSATVPGFLPSANAPLFHNGGWPAGLNVKIDIAGIDLFDINAEQMGLCGGMSFLTRDIFESRTPQLTNTRSDQLPLPVAQHILSRLVDSFGDPGVVMRWLHATQEPDHETWVWGRGLFSETVDEARKVMSVIDAGVLCPIGVVLTQSAAPWQVFNNHVELVWGYELNGPILTLKVYDCNRNRLADIDSRTITLDISSNQPPAKTITTNATGNQDKAGTVRGFFVLPYTHRDPSPAYVDRAVVTVSAPPPATMDPGARARVLITATNTGTTRWTASSGYRLAYVNPPGNAWGGPPPQPADTSPEHDVTFDFEVTAPDVVQRADLQAIMQRGGTPFGAPSPALWVQVGTPPRPPKPTPPDPSPCDLLRERYEDLTTQLATAHADISARGRSRDGDAASLDRHISGLQRLLEAAEDERRIRGCAPFPRPRQRALADAELDGGVPDGGGPNADVLNDDDPCRTVTLPDGRAVGNMTAEEYARTYTDGGPHEMPCDLPEDDPPAGRVGDREGSMVQARYFGPALGAGCPRQIVIHSVESAIRPGLARSLAEGWFRNPANQTSAHVICDPREAVDMVPWTQRAWHCGSGNTTSLGFEHTGRAAFTREEWTTPEGLEMLRNSAARAADACRRFDIPARWLSVAQVAADEKGLCTHNDMRLARGGTTHTDPGAGFPYDLYLQILVGLLQSAPTPPPPTPAPAPHPVPPAPVPSGSYTVRPGDTLTAIAARFSVSVADLVRWNSLANPDVIVPGQVLAVAPAAKKTGVCTAPPGNWSLPAGHFYGLVTGPAESHGGYYQAEREAVRWIQIRLQELGFAPTDPGWANGRFEQSTKDAVAAWQRARHAATTSRPGEVWRDDWQHLVEDR